MAQAPKDPTAFQVFTEIGIIEQLARNWLERNLPDNLKMSQFIVLNHLVRLGGEWSPARLASALQVTRGAMTNTLQRLEKRELIRIADDPVDGRAKLVSITDAGRYMRNQCVESTKPFFADLSRQLADKDFAKALPFLKQLRQYLDAHR